MPEACQLDRPGRPDVIHPARSPSGRVKENYRGAQSVGVIGAIVEALDAGPDVRPVGWIEFKE
jgi:hypothetical protein